MMTGMSSTMSSWSSSNSSCSRSRSRICPILSSFNSLSVPFSLLTRLFRDVIPGKEESWDDGFFAEDEDDDEAMLLSALLLVLPLFMMGSMTDLLLSRLADFCRNLGSLEP